MLTVVVTIAPRREEAKSKATVPKCNAGDIRHESLQGSVKKWCLRPLAMSQLPEPELLYLFRALHTLSIFYCSWGSVVCL